VLVRVLPIIAVLVVLVLKHAWRHTADEAQAGIYADAGAALQDRNALPVLLLLLSRASDLPCFRCPSLQVAAVTGSILVEAATPC
jgi:hypothetical protein